MKIYQVSHQNKTRVIVANDIQEAKELFERAFKPSPCVCGGSCTTKRVEMDADKISVVVIGWSDRFKEGIVLEG